MRQEDNRAQQSLSDEVQSQKIPTPKAYGMGGGGAKGVDGYNYARQQQESN